jgi:hypothetical protein
VKRLKTIHFSKMKRLSFLAQWKLVLTERIMQKVKIQSAFTFVIKNYWKKGEKWRKEIQPEFLY